MRELTLVFLDQVSKTDAEAGNLCWNEFDRNSRNELEQAVRWAASKGLAEGVSGAHDMSDIKRLVRKAARHSSMFSLVDEDVPSVSEGLPHTIVTTDKDRCTPNIPSGGSSPAEEVLSEPLYMKQLGQDVSFEGWDHKDEPLKLQVWDLGGQDQFYSIHSLFLSRWAVYLVVFSMEWLKTDAAEASKQKGLLFLRYWLGCIAQFYDADSTTSSFALVGTHKDTVSSPTEHKTISKLLYDTFSHTPAWRGVIDNRTGEDEGGRGLLWFFPVYNKRGTADQTVQELMKSVVTTLEEESYVNQKVPFEWIATYEMLQKKGSTTVIFHEVVDVARQSGLPVLRGNSLEEETKEVYAHPFLQTPPLLIYTSLPFISSDVMQMLCFFSEIGAWKYHDAANLSELLILNPAQFFIDPVTKVLIYLSLCCECGRFFQCGFFQRGIFQCGIF